MGVQLVDFIMETNIDKLNQLKREYFKDKPKTLHVTDEDARSLSPQKKIKPNPLIVSQSLIHPAKQIYIRK